MAEHGRDRFEAHPTVDRLGREGVSELVGVDVAEAGGAADTLARSVPTWCRSSGRPSWCSR